MVVVRAFDVAIRVFVVVIVSQAVVGIVGIAATDLTLTDPFLLTVGALLLAAGLLAVGPIRRWVLRPLRRTRDRRVPETAP